MSVHHLLIFFTLIFQSCKYASSLMGNETDHLSLIKFKESISSDPYHILDSWNSSTHFCDWHGITCSSKHRRVIGLLLYNYKLSGPITPFIGNLSFLRFLIIDNNNFHGEIPQELGRLFRLRKLGIQNNTMTGEFPINVTSCSNLKSFSFGGNHLTGKIPMEIGFLHNLEGLFLLQNNFTGEIPSSLWNLTSLSIVNLDVNHLEGSIPEDIGRLKNLAYFLAGANHLSGAIPYALYNLSLLTVLSLPLNKFNDSIPANMLSNLPNLQILELENNKFSGPIPISIENASMLSEISLAENHFTGQVPNLGKLHQLSRLILGANNLGSNSTKDWEFLTSLMNCSELIVLQLDTNNFGGNLPNTIGNLSIKLTYLYLEDNQVYGKIPEALGNLIGLSLLNMAYNHLADIIPSTLGRLQNMQLLALSANKLYGEIIHSIGNLTRLFILDLSNNMLEGQVSPSIRDCRSLQLLDLSKNHFHGAIPVQLITLSSLSMLLNLSHNSFGGDIPNEVGSLKNIGKLDVSHNHLSGSIPQSIGDCQSLEYLILQGNFFQETIPLSLVSLKGLRYLDLSQNNLSGSIPKGLQDLVFLEYLNVSFNILDGEVPSKGVFGNASAISLMGNSNLCGGISMLELPPCPIKSPRHRKHLNVKFIISICCVIAFLLLAFVVAIHHLRKRSKKSSSSLQTIEMTPTISYQSLHNATEGFSAGNLIGSGSFGYVYKGSIFESQEVVAIKVINLQRRGALKSFVAECNALKNAKHRNLVKIITCCSSIDYNGHEFKALVYEYMVNGSLENWLHPRTENLDHPTILLDQIVNILVDIGSALNYLHYEYGQPFVHCDLKPSNVLLDGDMVAHLSDFGLARLLSTSRVITYEQSSTIDIKGTVGYVPPEYGMGSEVSIQGDMYSFGILILEMLTKKKPTEDMFKDGHNLHKYVRSNFPNNLLQVVSPTILPIGSEHVGTLQENIARMHPNVEKCLCCLVKAGLACSMESPHERMSSADAIKKLISIKSFFPLW